MTSKEFFTAHCRKGFWAALVIVGLLFVFGSGCERRVTQEMKDRKLVNSQQSQYAAVHPVPYFDFSIPRDIYTQIYTATTNKSYATFSVIESITGETKFSCHSIGYAIPADTSMTNPLQRVAGAHGATSIEQAEPNGLFSSKNTDGTWVLCSLPDGSVTPIYSEHKVLTFPFPMKKVGEEWVRATDAKPEFTIKVDHHG